MVAWVPDPPPAVQPFLLHPGPLQRSVLQLLSRAETTDTQTREA